MRPGPGGLSTIFEVNRLLLPEMIELERDADECIPFNLRLMPTLRTMANSLRLAAESADGRLRRDDGVHTYNSSRLIVERG